MKSVLFTLAFCTTLALLLTVPVLGKEIMTDKELEQVGGAGFEGGELRIRFNSNLQPIVDPALISQLRANASLSGLHRSLGPRSTSLVITGLEPGLKIRVGLRLNESSQYLGSTKDPFRKVTIPSR